MKFLCVPCDTPMTLQSVGPPDDGSLSVVYSCPECGYEMAMLTNAYETQVVQSLGVRIGRAEAAPTASKSDGGCPFAAMVTPGGSNAAVPGRLDASVAGEPASVRWTASAEVRLEKLPSFIRPMARAGIEQFARERGSPEVDDYILDAAREFFGM